MDIRQDLGERVFNALSDDQRLSLKDVVCKGLCMDTRLLEPEDLYVCVGAKECEEALCTQAFEKGASAIVVIRGCEEQGSFDKMEGHGGLDKKKIPVVTIKEDYTVLGQMAESFYKRRPSLGMAVTGTNGKTSVSFFIAQMLSRLGYPTLVTGTLGDFVFIPEMITWERGEISLTSPDVFSLYKTLQRAYDVGIKVYVMEASSHGLTQGRLGELLLNVVGVTNVSPEHLDYHESMEAYVEAKCLLFSSHVLDSGKAVINKEDLYCETFIKALKGKKSLTYGLKDVDICLIDMEPRGGGVDLSFRIKEILYTQHLKMLGRYQGLNVLCALGMVKAVLESGRETIQDEDIADTFPFLVPPQGRMEFVGKTLLGGAVYVDYAHTPDAYEVVLKQIGAHAAKKLIVLFGCGGDRDSQKRPLLGEIASRYSDVVYLTDDNPRTENPELIRKSIRQGMKNLQCVVREVPDRKVAIEEAVGNLEEGDILLLLGKGHETYQKIGNKSFPHSDVAIAKAALNEASKRVQKGQGNE